MAKIAEMDRGYGAFDFDSIDEQPEFESFEAP